MKKIISIFVFTICAQFVQANQFAQVHLRNIYISHCNQKSDINEHIPVLKDLARQCKSVIEIGIRSMVSTWGVLQGLAEQNNEDCNYLGIDLDMPPTDKFNTARSLCNQLGIKFDFWQANDMTIQIPETDLLFIDSLHTYCHLTYELEAFAPNTRMYIALHDTSEPWGEIDDTSYHGDYSEYPAHYDRNKKGLWAAVQDFLMRHPEWTLHERRTNCHGFTILRRIK